MGWRAQVRRDLPPPVGLVHDLADVVVGGLGVVADEPVEHLGDRARDVQHPELLLAGAALPVAVHLDGVGEAVEHRVHHGGAQEVGA